MLSPSKRSSYSRCEQCHSKPATVKCGSCAQYMGNGGVVKLCYYCDTRIHNGIQEPHTRDILSIRDNKNSNQFSSSMVGSSRFFLSGEKPSTSQSQAHSHRIDSQPSEPVNYLEVIKLVEDNENQFLSMFSQFIKAMEPHLKPAEGVSENDERGKLLTELKTKCQQEAQINIQYKTQMETIKAGYDKQLESIVTTFEKLRATYEGKFQEFQEKMRSTDDMLKQVESSSANLENGKDFSDNEIKQLKLKDQMLHKLNEMALSKNEELKCLEEKAIGYKEVLTNLNSEKEQAQSLNEDLMTELEQYRQFLSKYFKDEGGLENGDNADNGNDEEVEEGENEAE